MKYLKYLLGLVLVLVLVFFGGGLLRPSVSYESEITVNKPIHEAWAVMSDDSKMAGWIKGFKKSELVSGTANTVGAVSNIYTEDDGQEMVIQETITAIQPSERIAMKFTMDFMDMDYEMSLKENNGNTTITSTSTTVGNGLFAKSLISFMKSGMKAQEDENMANLKKAIEENTTDYFPEPEPEPVMEEIEEVE